MYNFCLFHWTGSPDCLLESRPVSGTDKSTLTKPPSPSESKSQVIGAGVVKETTNHLLYPSPAACAGLRVRRRTPNMQVDDDDYFHLAGKPISTRRGSSNGWIQFTIYLLYGFVGRIDWEVSIGLIEFYVLHYALLGHISQGLPPRAARPSRESLVKAALFLLLDRWLNHVEELQTTGHVLVSIGLDASRHPVRYLCLEPFGLIKQTDLIGFGQCHNPFFGRRDHDESQIASYDGRVVGNGKKRPGFISHAFLGIDISGKVMGETQNLKVVDVTCSPEEGRKLSQAYKEEAGSIEQLKTGYGVKIVSPVNIKCSHDQPIELFAQRVHDAGHFAVPKGGRLIGPIYETDGLALNLVWALQLPNGKEFASVSICAHGYGTLNGAEMAEHEFRSQFNLRAMSGATWFDMDKYREEGSVSDAMNTDAEHGTVTTDTEPVTEQITEQVAEQRERRRLEKIPQAKSEKRELETPPDYTTAMSIQDTERTTNAYKVLCRPSKRLMGTTKDRTQIAIGFHGGPKMLPATRPHGPHQDRNYIVAVQVSGFEPVPFLTFIFQRVVFLNIDDVFHLDRMTFNLHARSSGLELITFALYDTDFQKDEVTHYMTIED
ncbi:hypothetical protein B0H63DRAFT_446791 [Podospora didyma]|uniref:Uncharacterized protein n=1 Tax=Podospora didyma TaxID=330526 RepID=A0AAE0NZW0_9PEZI|nr:hypothetical protein B0H63DRAFT_446791 [Podospora didyma]